jgi:RNA polymerase sigma-70 factor, ECF subfamily
VALRPQRPPDACPCRHGNVPAETAGQRRLLQRAAAGDREAFARLYDDQVEGVYRYLLAWTGDPAAAGSLTRQVFHTALSWLPTAPTREIEAGAWLIAMAHDAVAQRGGAAGVAGSVGPTGAAGPVATVARLRDPEREVVVLRLLLGHSLAHTAHLSGYSRRAVMELQLAACLSLQEQTEGTPAAQATPAPQISSAEEFERRLGPGHVDPTDPDPALAAALAVAGSLRAAMPGYMVVPDPNLVSQLRHELVTGRAGTEVAGIRLGAVRGPAGGGRGLGFLGAVQASVGGHHGRQRRDRRGPRSSGVRQAGTAGDLRRAPVPGLDHGRRGGCRRRRYRNPAQHRPPDNHHQQRPWPPRRPRRPPRRLRR